ncbi:major facilitator superfamily domain-containing protein, partial [Mycena galopus ATCC 62051]
LTETERARLVARLEYDSDAAHEEKFEWFFVFQAFTDHLVWAYALLFHGFAFVLYSLSLFLPTIIAGLGFSSWKAQLLTVPPNVLAAVSIWFIVWLSSRYDARAPFIIGSAVFSGYIVLLAGPTRKSGTQYIGVHLAAAGIYTGNALLLRRVALWPGENVSGQTKRAIAVAMQITIGDIGAIAGYILIFIEVSKFLNKFYD